MVGAAPWFGGSDVGACMELESTHDIGRHGVLVALDDERTPLASLADLVRHQMRCNGLALVEAVDAVVCMLKAQGDALVLYCTDPKTRARPIALAEPFTSAAMLGRLRQAWAVDSTTAADLNGAPFARLTMRRDVADWLFECGPDISFWDAAPSEPASVVPAHDADWMQAQEAALEFRAAPPAGVVPVAGSFADASAVVGCAAKTMPPDALAPATDALIVQPMGGAWPHLEGADWSAAEREAMFTMRHKHRMTGKRIAKITCVSRVRVDELIGKVSSPKTHQWPDACDWRPSATLLLACGFPVPQSLQAVPAVHARV